MARGCALQPWWPMCCFSAALLAWAVAFPLPRTTLHAIAVPTLGTGHQQLELPKAARAGRAAHLSEGPLFAPQQLSGSQLPHRGEGVAWFKSSVFASGAGLSSCALIALGLALGWATASSTAHQTGRPAEGQWMMCAVKSEKNPPDNSENGPKFASQYDGDYQPGERGTSEIVCDEVVIAEFGEAVYTTDGKGEVFIPPEALHMEYFRPSSHTTMSENKGETRYYDIVVNGKVHPNSAYYHPKPVDEDLDVIAGWVAFDEDVVEY
eukprot:GGOE01014443.1.p1 GENE.GGOE01014443.1~~GGOE01014443.1.p1  ORF type:complete len:265 (-),score=52.79 GGOE01014443.1:254-1048(-)